MVAWPDLLLDPAQLSSECQETRTGHFRNSLVVWIGDDIEQLPHTVTPDRRNDPELGKMGPDCIDHRGLLTDERRPWTGCHKSRRSRQSRQPSPSPVATVDPIPGTVRWDH